MSTIIEFKDNIITCPPTSFTTSDGIGVTLFQKMPKYGSSIAQIDAETGQHDTFADYFLRCKRVAIKLRSIGIKPGDLISVCTHHHINAAVPVIAAQFIGAITANLDPVLPINDTKHLLSISSPRIIFASAQSVRNLQVALDKKHTKIVIFESDEFEEFIAPQSGENTFTPTPVDVNSTAFICFSSGSTGLPKAVCLNHRSFLTHIHNGMHYDNMDPDLMVEEEKRTDKFKKYVVYASLYWISGMTFTFLCGLYGSCRIMAHFDAEKFWSIVGTYKPLCVTVLPVQAAAICKVSKSQRTEIDYKFLLRILTGGAPISLSQLQLIRDTFPDSEIFQAYGQTETTNALTRLNLLDRRQREISFRKPTSCGLPVPGVAFKIVDPDNPEKILGTYEKGELWVKSDLLMNGYLGVPASETFTKDGWLRTGDLMYYDEEFCFYVVDRLKEMLKFDGWVISPVIMEMQLLNHPAVMEAVVIGLPHEDDGDHAMGVVVLNKQKCFKNVTPLEIEKFVEQRVHEKQRLRAGVKILKQLPVTATGKIRRRDLRSMVLNGEI